GNENKYGMVTDVFMYDDKCMVVLAVFPIHAFVVGKEGNLTLN
ncbi:7076_t:CDS:2, partial [Funneliformis mosseae]